MGLGLGLGLGLERPDVHKLCTHSYLRLKKL